MTLRHLLGMLSLLALAPAQAHQIWVEQPPGQNAVIRFGEFGENLRESSPGLLDRFGRPTATLLSAAGEREAGGSKTATGFALPFGAGAGESIVAEDAAYPLNTYQRGDTPVTSWYRPAARLVTGAAAQPPRLVLDIVPTGTAGEFRVTLKGQPLPKAKVQAVVQSGWVKQAVTDAHGLVRFDQPWQGQYVIEVGHADRTPGERPGEGGPQAYDVVHYVTTLTVVKPDGLPPVPAGAAATPSR